MTLNKASFIDDGPWLDAGLWRVQAYMAGGRYEGVASADSMQVVPLDVPGNGVKILAGAAMVLNRYQSSPTEAYPVVNIGEELLGPSDMPAQATNDRSHLVCVTVGDPNFSQVGHPWMPAVVPAGEAETFEYVRFFVVQNVPAGTKRFGDLNLHYPAYALARIDIPANTTTVTAARIVDLREIPFPRTTERIEHISGPETANPLNGQGGTPGDYENFPQTVKFTLDIPVWASHAYLTGFVEGLRLSKAGSGKMRIQMGAIGTTNVTNIDEPPPAGASDRKSYNLGGEIPIPKEYRGTSVVVRIEATPNNTASKGFLSAVAASSGQIRVVLAEKAS